MPVIGKVELKVQLEKFVPEFQAAFLISIVDKFHSLLGLDFPTENDCMLCAKVKQTLPWEDTRNVTTESKTKYQRVNLLEISFNTITSS